MVAAGPSDGIAETVASTSNQDERSRTANECNLGDRGGSATTPRQHQDEETAELGGLTAATCIRGGSATVSTSAANTREVQPYGQRSDNIKLKLAWLDVAPMFQGMPADEYLSIAESCRPVQFKAGQAIVVQHDSNMQFFVIV